MDQFCMAFPPCGVYDDDTHLRKNCRSERNKIATVQPKRTMFMYKFRCRFARERVVRHRNSLTTIAVITKYSILLIIFFPDL